jgi:hypothetical protein
LRVRTAKLWHASVWIGWLADNFVIFRMRANPEPRNTIIDIDSKCSVTSANPDRPKLANTFEM